MSGFLRPDGSPCPSCGAPISRRRSAADPGEVMMRCSRCGWTGSWREPGSSPSESSLSEVAEDLAWLLGRDGGSGRTGDVIEFRPGRPSGR